MIAVALCRSAITEAAYVEYDADPCTEVDLVRAVESLGIRTLRTALP